MQEGVSEKKNSKRAEKLSENAKSTLTTIKTGLKSLVKDKRIIALIEETVEACTEISVQANMLASIQIFKILENENGGNLPIDLKFYRNCFSVIANLNSSYNKKYAKFQESLDLLLKVSPKMKRVRKEHYMEECLTALAGEMYTNFTTYISTIFKGRLFRWFLMKISIITDSKYFQSLSEKKLRTIASMMCRSSTGDETQSLNIILPQYTSLKKKPIPKGELEVMKAYIDYVRANLEGLLPIEKKIPKQYSHCFLPFLREIMVDIEEHNRNCPKEKQVKTFSLLPTKSFHAISIPIYTSSIKYFRDRLELEQEEDVWNQLFYIDEFMKGKGKKKTFQGFIKTDGVSVGVVLREPKRIKLEKNKKIEDPKNYERIIGLDPGRKCIFTGAIHSDKAKESFEIGYTGKDKTKYEIIKMSSGEFHTKCGYRNRTQMTSYWTSQNSTIKEYNKNCLSAKVPTLAQYLEYCKYQLKHLKVLIDFYGTKRFRRLGFDVYIKKQKTYEEIIKRITQGKKTLIAYGDASFPNNGKGTETTPTSTLRKKLSHRCKIVDYDEFRTSMNCCSCFQPMKGYKIEEGEPRSITVRHCQNNQCDHIVWNRDTNASINILRLYWTQAMGNKRPIEFQRDKK